MALDAIYIKALCRELSDILVGCKVDKVQQPQKDELIITFRGAGLKSSGLKSGDSRLLLSANSNYPRLHLTKGERVNPQSAPMFCMLLRKRLSGARLVRIVQPVDERIAALEFEGFTELGDKAYPTIIIEMMGRHSNIIFTEGRMDGENRILGAVKTVDFSMSSVRQIMAGISYELPPAQDKLSLFDTDGSELEALLKSGQTGTLDKYLQSAIKGISPIAARELAFLSCKSDSAIISEMSEEEHFRLSFFFERMKEKIMSESFKACMVADKETGLPFDFCFMEISQYGAAAETVIFDTMSGLLDVFYEKKDKAERDRTRVSSVLKTLSNNDEKLRKKLIAQKDELESCKNRDQLRMFADLLMANLHLCERGNNKVTVYNFFDEESKEVTIPLNIKLNAHQNAQNYYKEYKKAKSAEAYLTEQISLGEQELTYIDSVIEALGRAQNEKDYEEITDELAASGYMKRKRQDKNYKKIKNDKRSSDVQFMTFEAEDGFVIIAGKNNKQNDLVTLKTGKGSDWWFHAKNMPGCHAVILCEGRTPPESVMLYAAQIAATYSRGAGGNVVAVDYTQVKNVHKPSGAKPGMVIYEGHKTAFVTAENGK